MATGMSNGSDPVNGLGKQTEAPENRLPDLTPFMTPFKTVCRIWPPGRI
jgi:hypothetical protein